MNNILKNSIEYLKSYNISKQTVKNKRIVLNHLKSVPSGELYENFLAVPIT